MFKTEATPERLAKLPKWARDLIGFQAMRLKEAEATIDVQRGDKKSRVMADPWHGGAVKGTPRSYLKDDDTIRFQLGDAWMDHMDVAIQTRHDGRRYLLVRAGNGAMVVKPVSGNHMDLYLGER